MDVASGKLLCPPLRHAGWVHALAFDPDGTRLLTVCEDGAARLWDVRPGRLLDRVFPHGEEVELGRVQPRRYARLDGRLRGTVKLWDVPAAGYAMSSAIAVS